MGKDTMLKSRKLVLFALPLLLLAVTGAAFAGAIDFSYAGTNSSATWSWGGGSSTLTANANSLSAGLVGSMPLPINGNVLVTFTSGPGTGGTGTGTNPYTFGPSAPMTITIMGCLPGQGAGCTTVTLFSGQFLVSELGITGNGNFSFDGNDVSGTINPGVASYFGFTSDNVLGSLDGVLTGTVTSSGGSGLTGSGDLILTQNGNGGTTPEPSDLMLLGTGLLGLATYLRTKRRHS